MRQVTWTDAGITDLETILASIRASSKRHADRWADLFVDAAQRVARFPSIGWMVPEFGNDAIREVLVGPYRVIYELDSEMILILAVIHGRRDLERWLRPKSQGDAQ